MNKKDLKQFGKFTSNHESCYIKKVRILKLIK